MTQRIRVARLQITVEAFVDDGETLTPVEVAPLTIRAAQVADLPSMLAESVAAWQEALVPPDDEEGVA